MWTLLARSKLWWGLAAIFLIGVLTSPVSSKGNNIFLSYGNLLDVLRHYDAILGRGNALRARIALRGRRVGSLPRGIRLARRTRRRLFGRRQSLRIAEAGRQQRLRTPLLTQRWNGDEQGRPGKQQGLIWPAEAHSSHPARSAAAAPRWSGARATPGKR